MHVVVDIDSTLFPLLLAMRLVPGGEDVDYRKCQEWTSLKEMCTRPVDDVIHDAIQLPVARRIGLYAGATSALWFLQSDGVEVEIVTHRSERYRSLTEEFLHLYGLGHFPLTIGEKECKISRTRPGGVIVDDAPHVLEQAALSGTAAVAFSHPYNRQVREQYSLPSGENWVQLLPLIRRLLSENKDQQSL